MNGKEEERDGVEVFTLKDVYSNLFYFVRYDSFYINAQVPECKV